MSHAGVILTIFDLVSQRYRDESDMTGFSLARLPFTRMAPQPLVITFALLRQADFAMGSLTIPGSRRMSARSEGVTYSIHVFT